MEPMHTRLVYTKGVNRYTQNNLIGLCKRCDWFIHNKQIINITNTSSPKLIFICGYLAHVAIPYFVNNLLPTITNKFVLIVASGDYTFPHGRGDIRYHEYKNCQKEIATLLKSDLLIHIFVENLDTQHEKMSPILLGFSYPTFSIDLDSTEYYYKNYDTRKHLLFACHKTRGGQGQWRDRKLADDLCKGKWNSFTNFRENIDRTEFINELQDSKFCLCVHGGGYDPCPRFFESILYGAIPVIQHSPLDDAFKRFPVVFIDSLKENSLSKDFLESKHEELKGFYEGEKRREVLYKLTTNYWLGLINEKFCETTAIAGVP